MTSPLSPSPDGPLAGITILDLTQHLAGPFATQILADLGANVIKVEPLGGDPTRGYGPYFVDGDSAYFHSANRNKLSIAIDLKVAEGRATLLRLAEEADAIVDNFRPGTLARLGLGDDILLEANPRLVIASITGFGQDGPSRDLPAFDIVVQAISGGMSLTGEPGGPPVRSGLPIGDATAGIYGAVGIVAGLLQLSRTGRGSRVDVAMLDSQVALLSYVASYYLASGVVPGPQGRRHMSIPTYRAFTCSEGADVVVAANTQRFWEGLARAFGVPHLIDDPRFVNNEERRSHRDALDEALEAAARSMTRVEALQRLAEQDVPAAPINAVDDALADPQIVHRGMVLSLQGRQEPIQVVGNPVRLDGRAGPVIAPPHLGADTVAVLRGSAGLDDDALAELVAAGAIVRREPLRRPASSASSERALVSLAEPQGGSSEAETFVVLPGMGGDEHGWDAVALASVLPPNASAVLYVYPGFGERPASPDGYSYEDLADEVATLVPGPFHVLGVGVGASVAGQLFARHGDRVRSALLVSGGFGEPMGDREREVARARADAAITSGMAAVLDDTLGRWFTSDAVERRHPAVEETRAGLLRMQPESWAHVWLASATRTVVASEVVSGIRVPVTLLTGLDDGAKPAATAEAMHAKLATSRVARVPGPHMINLERPDSVRRALRDHLDWIGLGAGAEEDGSAVPGVPTLNP